VVQAKKHGYLGYENELGPSVDPEPVMSVKREPEEVASDESPLAARTGSDLVALFFCVERLRLSECGVRLQARRLLVAERIQRMQ
jgi:hypothetical protein